MEVKTTDIKKEIEALNKKLNNLLQSAETHIGAGQLELADNNLTLFIDLYPKTHVSHPELSRLLEEQENKYSKLRVFLNKERLGQNALLARDAELAIQKIDTKYVFDRFNICFSIFNKYKLGENEPNDYPL